MERLRTTTRIRAITAAALSAAALTTALTGCGGGPSQSACKTAMRAELAHAITDPHAAPGREPAACHGLPAATLRRLATQVLTQG
jgi:hypothetical protein